MGFAARQFLGERRMALERERHQEIEQGLMRLDRRYSREIGRLNHAFAEQYASASRFLIPDENCLKQKLPEMARRWGFDFCTVFGVKGEQQVSFRATEGRTTSPKLLQYLGKISAEAMRRSVSGEQSDLSEQRDLGKLEFIGLLPTVKGIDWGASKNIVGFFPLGQAVGRVTHLVVGLWDPARMQLDFLRRHAERESRMLGDGRLLIWCPQNPEIAFPESLARLRQLAALRPKVNNRAISYRSRMSLGGTSYLVTGVRFQQLNKFACLRLTPDHSIQFQIHDLTMKFWFIVVLISSLCALVGVVLADMILIPVRDLTSGLDALSRRDFRARIPVHHGDELGQAARLLNETAEGLQDLELAKTLQEAFFPTKPLLLGDLRIWGQSCFAGKVGGDYVDFFALDDHRGLFMIADVSGHGVAASLVVAMARAAFRHPAVGDDPMQLMQTLNALLLSVLRKKKMMTCCLGLFDVREHHVRLVNAGHPWPLHLHAGGAEFLKSIGMPLGSAKRWKAGEVACPLEPGDVVFCYSDGLVEARSGNGPIGFTRLSESAPSFVGSNAETTAALFWQWFAREAPESPPADDVSILILQRLLPEQGESS